MAHCYILLVFDSPSVKQEPRTSQDLGQTGHPGQIPPAQGHPYRAAPAAPSSLTNSAKPPSKPQSTEVICLDSSSEEVVEEEEERLPEDKDEDDNALVEKFTGASSSPALPPELPTSCPPLLNDVTQSIYNRTQQVDSDQVESVTSVSSDATSSMNNGSSTVFDLTSSQLDGLPPIFNNPGEQMIGFEDLLNDIDSIPSPQLSYHDSMQPSLEPFIEGLFSPDTSESAPNSDSSDAALAPPSDCTPVTTTTSPAVMNLGLKQAVSSAATAEPPTYLDKAIVALHSSASTAGTEAMSQPHIPLLSPIAARLLYMSTGTSLPSSPPDDVHKYFAITNRSVESVPDTSSLVVSQSATSGVKVLSRESDEQTEKEKEQLEKEGSRERGAVSSMKDVPEARNASGCVDSDIPAGGKGEEEEEDIVPMICSPLPLVPESLSKDRVKSGQHVSDNSCASERSKTVSLSTSVSRSRETFPGDTNVSRNSSKATTGSPKPRYSSLSSVRSRLAAFPLSSLARPVASRRFSTGDVPPSLAQNIANPTITITPPESEDKANSKSTPGTKVQMPVADLKSTEISSAHTESSSNIGQQTNLQQRNLLTSNARSNSDSPVHKQRPPSRSSTPSFLVSTSAGENSSSNNSRGSRVLVKYQNSSSSSESAVEKHCGGPVPPLRTLCTAQRKSPSLHCISPTLTVSPSPNDSVVSVNDLVSIQDGSVASAFKKSPTQYLEDPNAVGPTAFLTHSLAVSRSSVKNSLVSLSELDSTNSTTSLCDSDSSLPLTHSSQPMHSFTPLKNYDLASPCFFSSTSTPLTGVTKNVNASTSLSVEDTSSVGALSTVGVSKVTSGILSQLARSDFSSTATSCATPETYLTHRNIPQQCRAQYSAKEIKSSGLTVSSHDAVMAVSTSSSANIDQKGAYSLHDCTTQETKKLAKSRIIPPPLRLRRISASKSPSVSPNSSVFSPNLQSFPGNILTPPESSVFPPVTLRSGTRESHQIPDRSTGCHVDASHFYIPRTSPNLKGSFSPIVKVSPLFSSPVFRSPSPARAISPVISSSSSPHISPSASPTLGGASFLPNNSAPATSAIVDTQKIAAHTSSFVGNSSRNTLSLPSWSSPPNPQTYNPLLTKMILTLLTKMILTFLTKMILTNLHYIRHTFLLTCLQLLFILPTYPISLFPLSRIFRMD